MKRFHLYPIAFLLLIALLNVNCQKVSVAHITINNIGQWQVVALVEGSHVYIAAGNSHTFEIGWAGSFVLVEVRVYADSGNPDDYYNGFLRTNVELHNGDHLYYDVDVVPLDEQ